MGSVASLISARESRTARAELKRCLIDGDLSLSAALRTPVTVIGDMPVYELIKALPYIGNPRLALLNDKAIEARINLFLPIVVLTERQRKWLCYHLEDDGYGRMDQRSASA